MITIDKAQLFVGKTRCHIYAKLGNYFAHQLAESIEKKNFGDAERYQTLALKYLNKQCDVVSKLIEMAS